MCTHAHTSPHKSTVQRWRKLRNFSRGGGGFSPKARWVLLLVFACVMGTHLYRQEYACVVGVLKSNGITLKRIHVHTNTH